MHRADLAEEAGAKAIEHILDRDERLEEARYRHCIIGPGASVIPKRHRVRYLVWPPVKFRGAAEGGDQVHEARVDLGRRHRLKRKSGGSAIARHADDRMFDEIEGDLDGSWAVGNEGG